MMVAEIPESIAIEDCNSMLEALPQVKFILSVTPTAPYEQLFGIGQQKVVVQEVYSGKDVEIGQEIYIMSQRWNLCLYDGENSIERGFVNVLKPDMDYLVFCSETVDSSQLNGKVFRLYENSHIAPVFCFKDIENQIIVPSGESTYVPYIYVKNNEFFASTENAASAWKNLKTEMFKLFPQYSS